MDFTRNNSWAIIGASRLQDRFLFPRLLLEFIIKAFHHLYSFIRIRSKLTFLQFFMNFIVRFQKCLTILSLRVNSL